LLVLLLISTSLLNHGAVFAQEAATVESSSPPNLTTDQIKASMDQGVQYLIEKQNPNGSWGSPTRTKGLNIYAPVPGAHHAFRAATTSLCIAALIETSDGDERAEAAIARAEAWLFKYLPNLRRATSVAIYNVWGHAYSIQALIQMHHRHAGDEDMQHQIRDLIETQFDCLTRYESVDGGWGYYDFRYRANQPTSDSISFVNGAALIAMAQSKTIGLNPPERLVKRAIAATLRQRKPDFSYLYGEYLKTRPMRGINRPGGSLGRSHCCNVALRMWDDDAITDRVHKTWLDRLFTRGGWLDIGRKRPIPHESWFQVAGYFYYFGHYYASLAIQQLPEDERGNYQSQLATTMLDRQEKDGSWWDYPLYDYHQPYGTAFALMTLHRCLPTEP